MFAVFQKVASARLIECVELVIFEALTYSLIVEQPAPLRG